MQPLGVGFFGVSQSRRFWVVIQLADLNNQITRKVAFASVFQGCDAEAVGKFDGVIGQRIPARIRGDGGTESCVGIKENEPVDKLTAGGVTE